MAEKKSRAGKPEGGSIPESVRINRRKPIRVNADYTPPTIRLKAPDNEERKFYCCMCGKDFEKQKGNFPSGGKSLLWKGNNGYLPFCKNCTEILMQSMTSFYSGNEEHALRHLCSMFDWCYNDTASAMTLADVHFTNSRVSIYPSKMSARPSAMHGETFLDTIREEVEERDSLTDYAIVPDGDDSDFEVTREMIRTWGKGFTPDQYQFLEEEYKDWTTKSVCKTKAQEELFRNIALAQLDVRIARQNGGDVPKAQKALQDLMNSANILPKQNSDNILADTQTFGTLLKKFEETAPIPEPDERWKDVDGIRRYMNTWFRGGLAKALKISNENTALYDEAVDEMQRYTVQPVAISAAESANDSSIFDQNGGDEGGGNDE